MKIAFIGKMESPFIKEEYELLKKHYQVIGIPLKENNRLMIPLSAIRLFYAMKECNIVISEFASWNSALAVFFSKIFKKKSIVVACGIDTAYEPKINYGYFCHPFTRLIAMYCYHHADKIRTVGPTLKDDIIKNSGVDGHTIEFLPRGHNPDFWIRGNTKKENLVVTVTSSRHLCRFKVKGADIFLNIAKNMPDTRFVIIGLTGKMKEIAEKYAIPNLEILGWSSEETILSYFKRAKVYCQLSMREGLSNCLVESMLCNCISVTSDIESMNFVIGKTGFKARYEDVKGTITAIQKALQCTDEDGEKSREQALQFSYEKTINGLKKILEELYPNE